MAIRDDKNQEDFKYRIRKHRLSMFYRIALIILVLAAIGAVVYMQYRNKIYTSYQINTSYERESVSGATDVRLGVGVLTYSKDGVHCTNSKGEALWNQTYEMQRPMLSICQNVAAIADYNGRTIYLVNDSQKLGEVNTNMPIRSISVSANGIVAAVLEDSEVTWINLYDASGNMVVKSETRMKNTGYPTSVSISPNAKLMCVAYTYVDAGEMKTSVAFYNFGEVGQNYQDNYVSGYNYNDTFVPYVQFMDNQTAFAVADNRLMIYSGTEVPETKSETLLSEEIQAVYHSEKYIGLVFLNDSSEDMYRLDVYDAVGTCVSSIPFDVDSMTNTDIFFSQDLVTIYNETECYIYNLSGTQKYAGTFGKAVHVMIPQSNAFRYTVVTENTLDTIQLQ